MNNAFKGALLSGLVFPGLGQMMLKHYKRGIALMLAILAGMAVIIVKAVRQAITILEKIELEGGLINMDTITSAATRAATLSDSRLFNIALLAMVSFWLIGVIDAYKIGKKKDIEKQSMDQDSIG